MYRKQARKPLDEQVKTIKVKNPISQAFNGTGGYWTQENMEKQRSYNLPQWKALCEQSEHQPPAQRGTARGGTAARATFKRQVNPKSGSDNTGGSKSVASRRMHNQRDVNDEIDEEAFRGFDYRLGDVDVFDNDRCAQLEQQYWKGLTFSPPMYGADMPGSLFDDDTKVWNVAKLPNVLDYLDKAVPGVNTAYLYLGMWKATFAWHLEDVDLYSINYIHFGAPKQWYSISQADAPKFERAMKSEC